MTTLQRRLVLNFLNHGKWLLGGKFRIIAFFCTVTQVSSPVSSLLLDLGPVITIAERWLEGCLLSRQDLLPFFLFLAPPPPLTP